MERKNMVLLTVIAVATLLVAVVGATFAYFTATVKDERDGQENKGQADISSATKIVNTLTFENNGTAGSFTAEDVYPGHKEVAEIKVTASGDDTAEIGVAFKYNVTNNTFPTGSIKISLYKSTNQVTIPEEENLFGCTKTSAPVDGVDSENKVKLYENCANTKTSLNNADLVDGSEQEVQNEGTFEIGRDTITVGDADTTVYYYVVVEFVDKTSDQNISDLNKVLKGKIEVSAA